MGLIWHKLQEQEVLNENISDKTTKAHLKHRENHSVLKKEQILIKVEVYIMIFMEIKLPKTEMKLIIKGLMPGQCHW
jgi:hypothetical protein